jgi:hypothetical protein
LLHRTKLDIILSDYAYFLQKFLYAIQEEMEIAAFLFFA